MDHIEVMLSTWNGAAWLQPQLESLAAQTGVGRITLSVRDDGSTDDTWSVLERFAEDVPSSPKHAGNSALVPPAHAMDDVPVASRPTREGQPAQSIPPLPGISVRLHRGSNLGFIASFFTLLLRADPQADWYAFCDQDDVWQPDKLARAVEKLRQEAAGKPSDDAQAFETRQFGQYSQCSQCSQSSQPDAAGSIDHEPDRQSAGSIPLLYASRLTLVDETLRQIGQSGVPVRGPAFANAVVENIVTGATLVMNRAARNLLVEGLERMTGTAAGPDAEVPKNAVEGVRLHDWWCYLVVSAFGRVVYDSESRILYRQHGGNQVGWRPSFLARQALRLKRIRRQGDVRAITRQAALFARIHGAALDDGKSRILKRFLAKDEKFPVRVACVIHPGVWRQRRVDGVLLRLLILTGRI